jgi:hypothetical protein
VRLEIGEKMFTDWNRHVSMKSLLSLAFLTLIIGSGCADINVTKFDSIRRPATAGTIDVYSNPAAVTRPYKEIGLITAEEGWDNTEADLIQLMKEKAREMGPNAIILLGGGKTTSGGVVVGSTVTLANYNTTRCSAIVYTDSR